MSVPELESLILEEAKALGLRADELAIKSFRDRRTGRACARVKRGKAVTEVEVADENLEDYPTTPEIERMIRERIRIALGELQGPYYCPHCGSSVLADDYLCIKCGRVLAWKRGK